MKTQAQKLRELRNKILGEPKLEKGCQFIPKENTTSLTASRVYTILEECQEQELKNLKDAPYYYVDEYHYGLKRQQIVTRFLIKEILGKPVNWGEVLLMLMEQSGAEYKYFVDCYGSLFRYKYGDDIFEHSTDFICELDLTRSPEEQDEKTIEKIISLIK